MDLGDDLIVPAVDRGLSRHVVLDQRPFDEPHDRSRVKTSEDAATLRRVGPARSLLDAETPARKLLRMKVALR